MMNKKILNIKKTGILFIVTVFLVTCYGCAQLPEEQALVNKGAKYWVKGMYKEAIAEFDKALQINPNLAEAYNDRGNVYADMGNLDQAISDYSNAIEINPRARYYYNRGRVYGDKENFKLALLDFNKAIEINPKFVAAYNNRAIVYFLMKEYDKSWEDVNKAKALGYKSHPEFLAELRKASGRQK